MAEAERWRTWRAILDQKNEYIKHARRRAQIELCKALDAAGQIYVFGRGARGQFGAQGDAPSDSPVTTDNANSWLDFTDLVFIDPVGTGFSRSLVDEAETKMPSSLVYSNVTGKPYTSVDEIRSLLKRQLLEPVKWEQGTKDLVTLGCTQYVEAGPGKQLKAMMRRIDNDAWGKCITLDQT